MYGTRFELVEATQVAKIKVVGVGGAGGNAVNNMIDSGLTGVEFIAVNTDAQDLEKSKAPTKIQIGCQTTRGLGAGADPEKGRQAAEENMEAIRHVLEGADMVFIAAGLGGGTGTGASPVVADVAKEFGCLTVAVATKPFRIEGGRRMKIAEGGLTELKSRVDTIITIPNDKLLDASPKNASAFEAFRRADSILLHAVKGIVELINGTGFINVDFADVRAVMSERGQALMGTGVASGDDRAAHAANQAIANPLLDDVSIRGARGLLINVTGGEDITMPEFNEAVAIVQQEVDPEANVFMGLVFDSRMEGELQVTIIATGIGPRLAMEAKPDMKVIRKQAWAELGNRARDLDIPTYQRQGYQPDVVGEANPATGLDMSNREIPTFLRRAAD